MLALMFLWACANAKAFDFTQVVALAEEQWRAPYADPSPLPANLAALSYDELRDIRFAPNAAVWRMERLPFQIQFFHPGGIQKDRIHVNLVAGEASTAVTFDKYLFEYPHGPFRGRVPEDVGFSGLRIHYPLNRPDYLDELIVFQGASYFRALACDTVYGLSARALGLQIGEGEREEFPRFRHFWIEQPDRDADRLRIWALLDSPAVAGAYEFIIRPGSVSTIDIRAVLFFRRDIAALALAPLTSMHWFGENTACKFGDFRPEVHDSDGLLMHTGAGEWLWRPLANDTNRFRWSSFSDRLPSGYGLLQRDRDFANYQDLEAHYHERPSAWIEPGPEACWQKGEVRLVELPTVNEYGDNVNAFWCPGLPARVGQRMDFSYRLHWYKETTRWPPLGRTVATRIADISYNPLGARFVLDFRLFPNARDWPSDAIRIDLAADRARILGVFKQFNEYDGTWRVFFDVESQAGADPAELRCALHSPEGALTETWTYQWKPTKR